MDSTCTLPKKSQHAQYAQHFPIPAENVTAHESNQRLILLYGVGKVRSQAIATTKEVMKALCAMLNDLGKVDDSGLCTDQGQSNEYLVLKRERDEKRAVLYRLAWDQYLCYNTSRKKLSYTRVLISYYIWSSGERTHRWHHQQQIVNTKLPVILSHGRGTTVFLETYPFIKKQLFCIQYSIS